MTRAALQLVRLAQAATVALALALAAGRLGLLHGFFDNLDNFPAHFAVAFLACAIALGLARRTGWALAAIAGTAVSLAPIFNWYAQPVADVRSPGVHTVKVLVANVYLRNRQHSRLIRLIETENPDVVGLVEVNARWLRKLAPVRGRYPHRFELPDENFAGLALYSRMPFADARLLTHEGAPMPVLATTLCTPRGPVEFILAHTSSPLTGTLVHRRNEQLLTLARHVSESPLPAVVAGDLNVTMWNRNYRPLEELAGLRNARIGHGIGSTWPPVPAVGVPIDHILATEPLALANFVVHPPVGSDHLPISAELRVSALSAGRERACLRHTGRSCSEEASECAGT